MKIEEARKKKGMSRKEVSDWLDIPYRTLCGWENGERTCPHYVEKLIVEKIMRGKEEISTVTTQMAKKVEMGTLDDVNTFLERFA